MAWKASSGLDGGVEEPVLVVEGRRAGADHLQAGDLRRPVHEIVVQVLLDLPDLVQPGGEEHILADAAHQRHRGVRVHVDQARNGHHARTVHDVQVAGHLPVGTRADRPDLSDPALPDQDVLAFIPEGDVPEEDGSHQIKGFRNPLLRSLLRSAGGSRRGSSCRGCRRRPLPGLRQISRNLPYRGISCACRS